MVAEGALDFAYIDILPIFIDTPGGVTSYIIEPVVNEEFILACSRSYYENNIEALTYENLIRLDYIGYKRDLALFHSWFSLHFNAQPSTLNMPFTVDSAQAIITAIELDLGLGITVSHFMTRQITEGSIVPILVTEKKLQNTIACVRFREKRQTITETGFQLHLQQELALISDLFIDTSRTVSNNGS
jgi:DNA-binding transcriptional LysR family regulator